MRNAMEKDRYWTRSKKRDAIPVDVKTEILVKLPPKNVARLILVSKRWSSMIRDKGFTNMYLSRSSNHPRFLFTVCSPEKKFFYSCSQEDPSSDPQRVSITTTTTNPDHRYKFSSPPVRGLICCQHDTKVLVGNPDTGQFVTLPRPNTRRKGIFTFFGYDPVNDLYKVLCMTVIKAPQYRGSQVVSEEHQVFTLGAPKSTWRKVECKVPHLLPPRTKGLCMDGKLYYYAWIHNEGSLISFDLRCEEFNVIKLSRDAQLLPGCELVSYCGKIALIREVYCQGTLDVWVLEDVSKQEWRKISILIPTWSDLVGLYTLWFRGAVGTGQLIFAPYDATIPPSFFFVCYDLETNTAKKVVIDEIGDDFAEIEVFVNHTQSPAFLNKRTYVS